MVQIDPNCKQSPFPAPPHLACANLHRAPDVSNFRLGQGNDDRKTTIVGKPLICNRAVALTRTTAILPCGRHGYREKDRLR